MSLEYRIELSPDPTCSPLLLRIPCHVILKQTTNVEAWLRYLGFCICGVSGSLLTWDSSREPVTLTCANLFQHVERGVICEYTPSGSVNVVDPSAWNDRESVYGASESEAHAPEFAAGCKERDGGSVLENTPPFESKLSPSQQAQREEADLKTCHACHLLPHSKGDLYMKLVSQARTANPDDNIQVIDDIRNGITMHASIYTALIPDYRAIFLHVPNAYMKVEDAVLHDLDKAGARAEDEVHCHILTEPFCYGMDLENAVKAGSLWDNKCLRQPEDRSLWPPPFLWDFVFGVAATKNWATPETLPGLIKLADAKYNGHGALHNSSTDDDASGNGGGGSGGSTETEEQETEIGEEMRDIVDGYDIWDIMACIVPAHRVQPHQEAQERVTQWLRSAPESCESPPTRPHSHLSES